LKKEGRRTFPERRSCIFLCKNPITEEILGFRRLHYSQGEEIPSFRRLYSHYIARVRKFLVSAHRLHYIARVQKFLYVGKTSVFSMLLEGEASMVRWPLNGLDLTLFHDLVDHPNLLTLSSSAYKRRGALMEKISF
jgi:hypothetical protein